jgi:hypothetical protein
MILRLVGVWRSSAMNSSVSGGAISDPRVRAMAFKLCITRACLAGFVLESDHQRVARPVFR